MVDFDDLKVNKLNLQKNKTYYNFLKLCFVNKNKKMKNKYRLIDISDYNNDPHLDETTLLVKLSPLEFRELFDDYIFYPDKVVYFFFLLDEHHKDYFLRDPEDVKEIDFDQFIPGKLDKNDGTTETYYRHIEYINKILDYEFISELEMDGVATNLKRKLHKLKDLEDEQVEKEIKILKKDIEVVENKIQYEEGDLNLLHMKSKTFKIFLKYLQKEKKNRNYSSDIICCLDLNDFLFKSSDHIRYENGVQVSGPHGGAGRVVKVESNLNGGNGYSVTMYNLEGDHPFWQNNVQLSPKQMEVIESSDEKIVLRGFGQDLMEGSFSDFGLSILLENGNVEKCILHMHDRNINIEYLK